MAKEKYPVRIDADTRLTRHRDVSAVGAISIRDATAEDLPFVV